jgi:putative hydroxymethylpyrimidine transport system substrate-binding protein
MRLLSRNPWSVLPLVVATAVAAVAAGCGGGGGGTAQPATPATTAQATTAATTQAASTEGTTTEAAPQQASLKVALDWFPNPDHVSLYYALDKGYFTDENLDVQLKKPSDPTAGLKLVASNKFDLAVYYESEAYFAAENKIPVITVGSLIPNPLNSLMALAGSKVTGPTTIKGATIGVAGVPTDNAIVQTMEQDQHLSSSDVKVVNVGFNVVPALLSHKVDAIVGAYRNVEGIQIGMESGKPPVIVPLEALGVPHFDELVIVANKARLASDPAYAYAVKRFIVAMNKGAAGAEADGAGALVIMKKETQYDAKFLAESVPATIKFLAPPAGTNPGCLNLDQWATYGKWMVDDKLLKAPIDVSEVATNEYGENC